MRPSGAGGLRGALAQLGLSPLDCIGVGDAENDLAFRDVCGLVVAVANALPSVKERVAFVTAGTRGAGVVELIDQLLATELAEFDVTGAMTATPRDFECASGARRNDTSEQMRNVARGMTTEDIGAASRFYAGQP